MSHTFVRRALLSLFAGVLLPGAARAAQPGFDDDVAFLRQRLEVVVLGSAEGPRVAVVPAWQGRVVTSTVGGPEAPSYGWINRELAASGKLLPHMNAFGGEDRFWLGPEGGPFSIFFAKGAKQDLANWQTPAAIDTEPFETSAAPKPTTAAFTRTMRLTNASGTTFDLRVDRTVHPCGPRRVGVLSAVATRATYWREWPRKRWDPTALRCLRARAPRRRRATTGA